MAQIQADSIAGRPMVRGIMTTDPDASAIAAEILRQTAERGEGKSICPSEVARALAPGEAWRPLMGRVREAAVALSREGGIEILRKGKPVPPEQVRGVIRLRRPAGA
ncbi:DUF3253 domain-containing protein [Belnapia rosea]|uniref:DUF3253 domain-containing protein n=2 Tax=Belnapia rosea TaxID=938405 RepID=A0A1G6LVC9_9PROT|nr:DUF3253 domain-containing protein [Belnapia rosea]SDB45821.1 Protein of unknown function [Belnapia rosea]SDC47180.1 Protein of unknown function [Belnapia rosea]